MNQLTVGAIVRTRIEGGNQGRRTELNVEGNCMEGHGKQEQKDQKTFWSTQTIIKSTPTKKIFEYLDGGQLQ